VRTTTDYVADNATPEVVIIDATTGAARHAVGDGEMTMIAGGRGR
jgi:hypothetical protein